MIGPAADDRRLLQGDYHYPAHQEMFLDSKGTRALEAPATGGCPQESGHRVGGRCPASRSTARMAPAPTPFIFLSPGTARAGAVLYRACHSSGRAQGCAQAGVEVLYEKGCELSGCDRQWFPGGGGCRDWQADVAVVVLGGRSGLDKSSTVGEARDATDLRLTGLQEQLLIAVTATGTPTVLVVMSGRVHVLSDVADHVQALLVAWPLGEQGGDALADVLLGRSEPQVGWRSRFPGPPARSRCTAAIVPEELALEFYSDYTDCAHPPLFSFGHGLGYTTFAYSDLTVEATGTLSPVMVGVTVANTGSPGGRGSRPAVCIRLGGVGIPATDFLIGFSRVRLARRRGTGDL